MATGQPPKSAGSSYPTPLNAPPENYWYKVDHLVAICALPLDKYGRVVGARPIWCIIPSWAKVYCGQWRRWPARTAPLSADTSISPG